MKKTEQQQQAHNLYFQTGLSQQQIAKVLDVDRKTIHNWVSEGNWQQLKKLANHMPSKIVEQYYYMLANMNYEILSRAQQPYPLTHEVEMMRQVNNCIKNLKNKQTVNESMEAYTHLAENIEKKDPALAAMLRPHIQDYIAGRSKIKFADLVPEDMVLNPKMDQLFDYELRPEDDDDPRYNEIIDSLMNRTPPDSPHPDEDTEGGQPTPPQPDVTSPSPLERVAERSPKPAPGFVEEQCLHAGSHGVGLRPIAVKIESGDAAVLTPAVLTGAVAATGTPAAFQTSGARPLPKTMLFDERLAQATSGADLLSGNVADRPSKPSNKPQNNNNNPDDFTDSLPVTPAPNTPLPKMPAGKKKIATAA